MSQPIMELEGTAEEIRAQLPDTPGQRFHVTVRPLEAEIETDALPPLQSISEKILARAQSRAPEDLALLPSDLAE